MLFENLGANPVAMGVNHNLIAGGAQGIVIAHDPIVKGFQGPAALRTLVRPDFNLIGIGRFDVLRFRFHLSLLVWPKYSLLQ